MRTISGVMRRDKAKAANEQATTPVKIPRPPPDIMCEEQQQSLSDEDDRDKRQVIQKSCVAPDLLAKLLANPVAAKEAYDPNEEPDEGNISRDL